MYPTESLKNGPLKLNNFAQKQFENNIMLKTIHNLCYNKNSVHQFNMSSPFLVDNILHQQKAVNLNNQYLNQQIESYVMNRRYEPTSRDNSPEIDNEFEEPNKQEESTKIENDDDSKHSREEEESTYNNIKPEYYRNDDFYNKSYEMAEDTRNEKEVLNIPVINRNCQNCGSSDCSPFACKKSGIRRLEELEKRFNLHRYNDNSGDEGIERDDRKYNTDELVKHCDEYGNEPSKAKPLLKFSVSAILGHKEDQGPEKINNITGKNNNARCNAL